MDKKVIHPRLVLKPCLETPRAEFKLTSNYRRTAKFADHSGVVYAFAKLRNH